MSNAGSQKATYNKQESRDAIAVMMCIPLSGVSASLVSSPPCPSPEHSASASETPHYVMLIAHANKSTYCKADQRSC